MPRHAIPPAGAARARHAAAKLLRLIIMAGFDVTLPPTPCARHPPPLSRKSSVMAQNIMAQRAQRRRRPRYSSDAHARHYGVPQQPLLNRMEAMSLIRTRACACVRCNAEE